MSKHQKFTETKFNQVKSLLETAKKDKIIKTHLSDFGYNTKKIREGEDLFKEAFELYNKNIIGSNPDRIKAGMKLIIPILTSPVPTVPVMVAIAGTGIASTVETVVTANVSLEWLGIQMNLADPISSGVKFAEKTAALVAVTPLSFAAETAAAGLTSIKGVQVILDATGEDVTSGLRVDWTAQEVESNIAVASVTIYVTGE